MRDRPFVRAERLALALTAAALLLAALACLGGAAFSTAPWWTHPTDPRSAVFRAGDYGLSVQITDTPGCTPLQYGCLSMHPDSHMYLSVWVATGQANSAGATAWARPLAQVRLR